MNPNIIKTKEGIHVLKNDTHLSRWIEEHGRLDIAAHEISFFSKYIPEGGVVVDAGACLGDHTATYAQLVGPSGEVIAFEPHPDTREALKLNFQHVQNVSVIGAALGSKMTTAKISLSENIGASYIAEEGSPTSMVRLDDLPFTRLDFIHLDCEGMEFDVIFGATETLAKHKPVIVLEINHDWLVRYGQSETTLTLLLHSLGYRCEELHASHGPHLVQRDIICFPK